MICSDICGKKVSSQSGDLQRHLQNRSVTYSVIYEKMIVVSQILLSYSVASDAVGLQTNVRIANICTTEVLKQRYVGQKYV